MKIKFLLLLVLVVTGYSNAQHFEWVQSNQITYSLNPGLPSNCIAKGFNNTVVSSRLQTSNLVFGQDVLGDNKLMCTSSSGNIVWQLTLGDSVAIKDLTTDNQGNIYVAGSFMGVLSINGLTDTLQNNFPGLSINDFILKFDASGILLWMKNISLNIGNFSFSSFACDKNNNMWFSMSDFFDSKIFKTDVLGNVTDSFNLPNAKGVSGMSFDAFDALYVSGATGTGTLTIGNMNIAVPETYMMYVARYNSSMNASWIYLAHDITFQNPEVASDLNGGVYFSGNVFDSLSWGNLHFHDPQWTNNFFLTRIDSSGNFMWGRQATIMPVGSLGRFSLAETSFLDVDPAGNPILFGTINGTMDWGNNVMVSDTAGQENLHIVAFDANNTALWQKTCGAQGNYPSGIIADHSGNIYFTGGITGTGVFDSISVNSAGPLAIVLAKISLSAVAIEEIFSENISVYPNPTNGLINIPEKWLNKSLSILDSQGRVVKYFPGSDRVIYLDLPAGLYLIRCDASRGKECVKILVN